MSAASIRLSVLIPSVPERFAHLTRVYGALIEQVGDRPVEVLVLVDNKRRTTGHKRNDLVRLARGEYVAFVDDDDRIGNDYIAELLRAIDTKADCILFDVMVNNDGVPDRICRYDRRFRDVKLPTEYRRKPNHLMCYRREIALRHEFRDQSFGEDGDWAARASRDIRTQTYIRKTLYHYDYVAKALDWYYAS